MFGFGKRDPLPAGSIAAAASGEIIPIEKVNDEVFARKMMGDGAAIIPSEDCIVAPCSGTVSMLYPTLHAFGITSEDGVDILVHIGIDTVRLKGKGFRSFVKEGQKVRAGDRIIKVDTHDIKNKGLDLTTMILFPDCSVRMDIRREGRAIKGRTVIATYTL